VLVAKAKCFVIQSILGQAEVKSARYEYDETVGIRTQARRDRRARDA
jgi:hypothetical protein